MARKHQHQPIATEGDTIRLLDLFPAWRRGAPVQCQIRQVRLEDARDKYVALSYVWGAKEGTVPITCDGCELLVTPNCHDAIIELRYKFHPRTLWIDSICIDQSGATGSTEERNHQVRLMGRIYHNASTVVVWLGMEALRITTTHHIMSRCDRAITHVYFLHYRRIDVLHNVLGGVYKLDNWLSNDRAGKLLKWYEKKQGIAGRLDKNIWFSRVWTVQEFIFARRVIFASKQSYFTWSTLSSIYGFSRRLLPNIQPRVALRQKALTSLKELEIRSFLRSIGNLESTLPHDKIYGLYSIFKEIGIDLPDPNYNQPIHEVLADFTRAFVSHNRNLNLITTERAGHELPQLPSWVPTLLTPRPSESNVPDTMGETYRYIWPEPSASRSSKMHVRSFVRSYRPCPSTRKKAFQVMDFKSYYTPWSTVYVHDQTCDFGQWYAMMADPEYLFGSPQNTEANAARLGNANDRSAVVYDYLCNGQGPNVELFRRAQVKCNKLANWAFITTDNGHIGRAYRTCKQGDEAWLLAGSTYPVILRPTEDGFRYIAPAFLPNTMDGQLWPDDEEDLEILTLV
ncbi:hypothetical protein PG988_012513 [Apiospora saccharicola]